MILYTAGIRAFFDSALGLVPVRIEQINGKRVKARVVKDAGRYRKGQTVTASQFKFPPKEHIRRTDDSYHIVGNFKYQPV